MKKLGLLLALVCGGGLAGVSFAEEGGQMQGRGEHKQAMFEQHKAQMLKGIDEQITALQNSKTCVAAAQDREALKGCHEAVAQARKQYRSEMLDARIKHLEEAKSKMKH